jgi:hypothetical protein
VGAVVLTAVSVAQPAPRTESMIGAPISVGQRYEWASAREPHMLYLCEPHLAQLRRVLPKNGVWIIEQLAEGSTAENSSPQHD